MVSRAEKVFRFGRPTPFTSEGKQRRQSPLLSNRISASSLRLCQFLRQNRSQIQRVLLGQRLNTLNNALFRLKSQIFNCLQFSESDRVRVLGNCLNDSRCPHGRRGQCCKTQTGLRPRNRALPLLGRRAPTLNES